MEILILVLLYYLSQNPNFAESVKPLMGQLKDSEQMLNFLNDLSKFSGAFGGFGGFANNAAQKTPPNDGTGASTQENGVNVKDSAPSASTAQSDSHANQQSAAQENKKSPQSPTAGIADEFIQNILDSYLKKR